MINASLRTHLTLWFAGLSLLTLLSVGIYVGHIATEQMKQASGNALLSTARSTAALLAVQLRERQLEVSLLSKAPLMRKGNLDAPDLLDLIIGVSIAESADRDSSALLKRADMQLYQAKGAGRNRVA